MKIRIDTIPHDQQRYNSVGDWIVEKPDTLNVRVSKMSDERYEFLVALHEMIEATICAHRGIKQSVVDQFDLMFEAEREAGKHTAVAELGDDPRCPYRDAHRFATIVERMMAAELEVDWSDYEEEIETL